LSLYLCLGLLFNQKVTHVMVLLQNKKGCNKFNQSSAYELIGLPGVRFLTGQSGFLAICPEWC